MMDESKNFNDDQALKAENEFLKLKLMAEHGGHFYPGDVDVNVPAEIENQFLSNVIEFERQFASRRSITVFEKIGSPQHFKPETEIPDGEIDQAWENLSEYMGQHGVDLSACSPRVTARQLYRFTTEELFKHETDDINIPGMMTGFIYDEFYPDHEYDNTRTATNDCMRKIFRKEPFEWMHDFAKLCRLNGYTGLTQDEFKKVINRFKDLHDEIELHELSVDSAKMREDVCVIKGNYSATASSENETAEYKGKWLVEFARKDDADYWYITNVQIGGLNF